MSGFVDLHLHALPGVDDGCRNAAESAALCIGLRALGFRRLVTTPHIRAGMFPNEPDALTEAWRRLDAAALGGPLELGAEHHLDDTLLPRIEAGRAIAYPGRRAILVELPDRVLPPGTERVLRRIRALGLLPVVAHPERCRFAFERTDELDPLLDAGVALLGDLMSLVGHYGAAPERAALRMLEEGSFDALCTDAHGPNDLPRLEHALHRLEVLVGGAERDRLLGSGPRALLDGTPEG